MLPRAGCFLYQTCRLLLLSGLTGCGPAVLSVDDAVARKGGQVSFVAYVGREHLLGLRSEIEHIPVTFHVAGQQLGSNSADDEGRAAVSVDHLDNHPARFTARARVQGRSLEAEGRIFHWRQNRVIVAVDIDHTISNTDYRRLILKEQVLVSPPILGARETLNGLADDFYILYLTGRPRFLIEKTRQWLDHYGFPAGPVITAPRFRDSWHQLKYKRTTLFRLRRQWPDLLIGIGNRTTDIDAYASNRMLPVIVYSGEQETHSADAVVLQNWGGVRQFFEANARTLTCPPALNRVIQGQAMILRPLVPYRAAPPQDSPRLFETTD